MNPFYILTICTITMIHCVTAGIYFQNHSPVAKKIAVITSWTLLTTAGLVMGMCIAKISGVGFQSL